MGNPGLLNKLPRTLKKNEKPSQPPDVLVDYLIS